MAEVRQMHDPPHMKLRVGREGPRVNDDEPPIPKGPEYWFEDVRAVMQAMGEAFVDAAPVFIESERERMRQEAAKRGARMSEVVSVGRDDWVGPLQKVAGLINGAEGGMLNDVDDAVEAALDDAEARIGG